MTVPVQEVNNNLFLITCTNREQIFVYMKEIKLTKGQIALVDDKDFKKFGHLKWNYQSAGYAQRRKNRKILYLHREIMNPPKHLVVDHIDGNGLNNQRINLRICSESQNSMNRWKRFKGKNLKGAYWHKRWKVWFSSIKFKGKGLYIGTFQTEHLAALAYDLWATELFGEYARTNFKVVAHSSIDIPLNQGRRNR